MRVTERVVPVFLPVLTAVLEGLWAVSTFVTAQHEAGATAAKQVADTAQAGLIEAQRPFLDKPLELCMRASKGLEF